MVTRSLVVGIVVAGVAVLATSVLFGLTVFAAEPTYDGTAVKTITADLKDGTGATVGAVQLSQDAKGVVQLTVSGAGLAAGDHGIHIHTTGKCDRPAFTSANGHFNIANHQHGLANPSGPHEGDLPGLTVAANGTFAYTATTDRVSLTGGADTIFDADGSALVLHAGADDQVTDPTGNSGGRVACAGIASPSSALAPLPPATGTGPAYASTNPLAFTGIAIVLGAVSLGGLRLARAARRSPGK
jgi:Cu-Zn family superoxide dismutase